MKSFKIAIAILSSALLLTACGGGSSSSSGSEEEINPNASLATKSDALVGYWKSECITYDDEKTSKNIYLQVQKNSYGELIGKDLFVGLFQGLDCKGESVLAHDKDGKRGEIISKEELEKMIFNKRRDQIVIIDFKLYRMSSRDFPRYNYTNAE